MRAGVIGWNCASSRTEARSTNSADRVYIINDGHIVEALTSDAVRDRAEVLHRHLGV
jgi:ABC-type branched-subunit amino acid transport system ATPase component